MKKLLVVLMVLVFAAPAIAADWNFYGSARMATFYTNEDSGDLDDLNDDNADGNADELTATTEDTNFAHGLQGNARIGANVKVSDEIGGGFEYGSGPNLRKLFGTYTFGGGQILVGQTYTPTSTYFYSNSVFDGDGDLLGLGQFYHGRRPMIQLKTGGFKVALVTPAVGVSSLGSYNDVDNTLPKIEVAYNMKSDGFFVDVFAGYLGYTLEDNDEGDDVSISAYTFGIGGGLMLGPANIKLHVNTGQNYGAYGAYQGFTSRSVTDSSGADDVTTNLLAGVDNPFLVDGDVEDTSALQALLVVNFKASDMLTVEGGYGYAKYSNDEVFEEDYVKTQYYINATVNIAPGFFIVPEIGMVTYGDAVDGETDLGTTTYYGVKTQINF